MVCVCVCVRCVCDFPMNERTNEERTKERDSQLGQAVVFVQDDEGVALLVGHLIAGVLEVDDLVSRL